MGPCSTVCLDTVTNFSQFRENFCTVDATRSRSVERGVGKCCLISLGRSVGWVRLRIASSSK